MDMNKKDLRYFVLFTNHPTLTFSWYHSRPEVDAIIEESKTSDFSVQVYLIDTKSQLVYRTIRDDKVIFNAQL